MPDFKSFTRWELDLGLVEIGKAIYTAVAPLEITAWRTAEPVPFAQRQSGEELHLAVGDKWGDLFDCAWFHFTGQIPPSAAGQHTSPAAGCERRNVRGRCSGQPAARPDQRYF